eukprot:9412609-Heterocapsa_arctica.AAC.1
MLNWQSVWRLETTKKLYKINRAEDALEGLGENPKVKSARKSVAPHEDICEIASEIKVTGLRQTTMSEFSHMSAGGAAPRGQYQWEPDSIWQPYVFVSEQLPDDKAREHNNNNKHNKQIL